MAAEKKMRVTIFGGSGFIGRHLAAELSERGYEVKIPSRDRERAKAALIVLPTVSVEQFNPNDFASVRAAVAGSDVVINLVGILHERHRREFEATHAEFTRRICEACGQEKPRQLIHISALNAAPGAPSRYLRTKAAGEHIVRRSGGEAKAAVIRPSVVFGKGDGFIHLFSSLARQFPILPLACPHTKFQPIWVEDLARMIAIGIGNRDFFGATLLAGGPRVYTLADIVRLIVGNRRRLILPLNRPLSFAFAWLMEQIPFVNLLTRDNCRSMSLDSICRQKNDAAHFLGRLKTLEAELADSGESHGYDDFRHFARR